jgi:hypothetical protein
MKVASNGCNYWQFDHGMAFLENKSDALTIKCRKRDKKTNQYRTVSWLQVSWRQSPVRVYAWSRRKGLRNVTYLPLQSLLMQTLKFIGHGGNVTDVLHSYQHRMKETIYQEFAKHNLKIKDKEFPAYYYWAGFDWLDYYIHSQNLPYLNNFHGFHKDLAGSLSLPLPKILREGLKVKDGNFKEVVHRWFGRSNKQLVKRLANLLGNPLYDNHRVLGRNLNLVALAIYLSKDWAIDYIYEILDIFSQFRSQININELHEFLANYTPRHVIDSLNRNADNLAYLSTIVKNYPKLKKAGIPLPKRLYNLHRLNTRINNQIQIHEAGKRLDDKLPNSYFYLDGLLVSEEHSDLEFTIPKTVGDLVDWGDELYNCLGAYWYRVEHRHCDLIGLKRNGKLEYALELTPDERVETFLGYRNRIPSFEDDSIVSNELERHIAYRKSLITSKNDPIPATAPMPW